MHLKNMENNQPYIQQLNPGSTWQWRDINSSWKPGHLPQGVLSDIADPYNKMSGYSEGYHFNGHGSWDLKQGIHDHFVAASPTQVSDQQHKINMNFSPYSNSEACLVLRVPPENRFRYRYDTEMSGTHGSLQGIRTAREKSVPTIELLNYPFEALIRVTLVTCCENDEHYPHPHSLFVREKLYGKKMYDNWDRKCLTKTGHFSDPHYIRVGRLKNDYTARFEGMCIISSKKENFHSSVREKLQMRSYELNHGMCKDESYKEDESEDLARKVEAAVSSVDVDFVSLCFEAFREEDGKLFPICSPLYSEPIGNAKSAKTGKLKISRINKCSGSCKGGDEIWLLVEKINKKGLVVRFSEECNGKITWESCIEGDDIILHHQYAIIFKTPSYRDVNISSEVEVLMRLERRTQPNQPCDYSEPITFVYEPLKCRNKGDNLCRKESIIVPLKQFQTKRARTDSSCGSNCNYQSKRKTDDLELEGMDLEDSEEDIEHLLFDGKDSFELDQTWGKFNAEEFLRFISSDDIDMPMQRDGIAQHKFNRDFFYKLYVLYSKLDENDIKKLTDQISSFRVSKKEVTENKSGLEKDQVKDAASTLLSLRSKALVNNVSSGNKNISSERIHTKTESLNRFLESCCDQDLELQSPIDMSVIKLNLPKSQFPLIQKEGKCKRGLKKSFTDYSSNHMELNNLGDGTCQESLLEPFACKVVKKETDLLNCLMNLEQMKSICKILNENGTWQNLAEMWNCCNAIPSARESTNPTEYIFEYAEQAQGAFEVESLRSSLEALNEKEALQLLEEILGKFSSGF